MQHYRMGHQKVLEIRCNETEYAPSQNLPILAIKKSMHLILDIVTRDIGHRLGNCFQATLMPPFSKYICTQTEPTYVTQNMFW
jgi:hypothetical protein